MEPLAFGISSALLILIPLGALVVSMVRHMRKVDD